MLWRCYGDIHLLTRSQKMGATNFHQRWMSICPTIGLCSRWLVGKNCAKDLGQNQYPKHTQPDQECLDHE